MRCEEKTRYTTQKAATVALARLHSRPRDYRVATRSYLCPHCRGWHLTSQERKA